MLRVILPLLIIHVRQTVSIGSVKTLTKYMEDTGYVPQDRPNLDGAPENITVQFQFYAMRCVNEHSFSFKLTCNFQVRNKFINCIN